MRGRRQHKGQESKGKDRKIGTKNEGGKEITPLTWKGRRGSGNWMGVKENKIGNEM